MSNTGNPPPPTLRSYYTDPYGQPIFAEHFLVVSTHDPTLGNLQLRENEAVVRFYVAYEGGWEHVSSVRWKFPSGSLRESTGYLEYVLLRDGLLNSGKACLVEKLPRDRPEVDTALEMCEAYALSNLLGSWDQNRDEKTLTTHEFKPTEEGILRLLRNLP
jgi:hypothetical protein